MMEGDVEEAERMMVNWRGVVNVGCLESRLSEVGCWRVDGGHQCQTLTVGNGRKKDDVDPSGQDGRVEQWKRYP